MQLGVGLGLPYNLGKPAAVFSPLDLSPVLWLDASDTSTITESGGAVSQWDDKSGNGYHLTQDSAALQPTTGTTINGLNVLTFNTDELANASLNVADPVTVFLVATAADANSQVVYDGLSAGRLTFYKSGTGSKFWSMFQGTVITSSSNTLGPAVFSIVHNQASSIIRVDGVQVATGNPGTQDNTGYKIGRDVNNTGAFGGKLAELVIVDGTLSAGEIADTESYLADKWGITL